MRELPELQIIVNQLKEALLYAYIDGVDMRDERARVQMDAARGQKVIDILRHGKSIRLQLSRDAILITLDTGAYLMLTPDTPRKNHTALILNTDMGRLYVIGAKAEVQFVKKDETYIPPLGVDPLTKQFNFRFLYREMKKCSVPIENFLTDQAIIAGIGKTYAQEILEESKLKPTKQANAIDKRQARDLFWNIKNILREAIVQNDPNALDAEETNTEEEVYQNAGN